MESLDDTLLIIGEKLRYLRTKAGFESHEKFAITYDISRSLYWKIENGKANMTMKTFIRLLDIHSISLEVFMSKTQRVKADTVTKGRRVKKT